jgi:hypothetical protein
MVHIEFDCEKSGAPLSEGEIIATLPPGYRPIDVVYDIVTSYPKSATGAMPYQIAVAPSGALMVYTCAPTATGYAYIVHGVTAYLANQ